MCGHGGPARATTDTSDVIQECGLTCEVASLSDYDPLTKPAAAGRREASYNDPALQLEFL